MDKERLIPEDRPRRTPCQMIGWVMLLILAGLTILCAVVTAVVTKQPNGYVYKLKVKKHNYDPYYKRQVIYPETYDFPSTPRAATSPPEMTDSGLDFDQFERKAKTTTARSPNQPKFREWEWDQQTSGTHAEPASTTTTTTTSTTSTPETFKIEHYAISEVCWDYSGIWGGFLMLIFTIAMIYGREKSMPVLTGVCKTLAILTSFLVAGVAIVWAFYAVTDGGSVAYEYRGADGYLSDHYYRHRGDDDAILLEDHSRALFLTMASTVGIAVFSSLYFIVACLSCFCSDVSSGNIVENISNNDKCNNRKTQINRDDLLQNPIFCKMWSYWCFAGLESVNMPHLNTKNAGNNVSGDGLTNNNNVRIKFGRFVEVDDTPAPVHSVESTDVPACLVTNNETPAAL